MLYALCRLDDNLLKIIPENLLISSSQLKLFNKPIGHGMEILQYQFSIILEVTELYYNNFIR